MGFHSKSIVRVTLENFRDLGKTTFFGLNLSYNCLPSCLMSAKIPNFSCLNLGSIPTIHVIEPPPPQMYGYDRACP